MSKCQHFPMCPLYIASHEAGGFGCVDDMALPCMVERGVMNKALAINAYLQSKHAKEIDAGWLRDMPAMGSA